MMDKETKLSEFHEVCQCAKSAVDLNSKLWSIRTALKYQTEADIYSAAGNLSVKSDANVDINVKECEENCDIDLLGVKEDLEEVRELFYKEEFDKAHKRAIDLPKDLGTSLNRCAQGYV